MPSTFILNHAKGVVRKDENISVSNERVIVSVKLLFVKSKHREAELMCSVFENACDSVIYEPQLLFVPPSNCRLTVSAIALLLLRVTAASEPEV